MVVSLCYSRQGVRPTVRGGLKLAALEGAYTKDTPLKRDVRGHTEQMR